VASSSERARLLELFEVQNEQGPCLDCFRSGDRVVAVDLNADPGRWPLFTAEAIKGWIPIGPRAGPALPEAR